MIKSTLSIVIAALILSSASAQQLTQSGFVITMKNGSVLRGRTLARDASSGTLSLSFTESAAGTARSYAVIAMDDAESIKAGSTESESILIKLAGGSEIRCKEFGLSGDTITVKIGTASKIDIRWDQIESISFGQ